MKMPVQPGNSLFVRSFEGPLPYLAALLTIACSPSSQQPESDGPRPVHWSYETSDGPDRWAQLDPAYATCGAGRNQSPIDLFAVAEGEIVAGGLSRVYGTIDMVVRRTTQVTDLLDNGHTIQVDAGGLHIDLNDLSLDLVQFHFHSPSEHRLRGEAFPMEIHFVHSSEYGALAVMGVFVTAGEAHPEIANLIANLPEDDDEVVRPGITIDVHAFIPFSADSSRFRYSGSLTTPPCTEGVRWVVFPEPIEASPDQIEALRSRMPVNNRPVQALNGRLVTLLRH
jgi:carbonic anhydrase